MDELIVERVGGDSSTEVSRDTDSGANFGNR